MKRRFSSLLQRSGVLVRPSGRTRFAGLLVAAVCTLGMLQASQATAALIYGVTSNNTLFSFDSAAPNTLLSGFAISNLQPNENVLGIDFRPADGQLYAVGSSGRVYTLSVNTGAASLASILSADGSDATNPFTQLNGTDFGVDFNPVADRLRVVSNTRQNLRINVTTGATITDGNLNPSNPNITMAGYTNSFPGATSTTLFTIDSNLDVLNTQNPPNDGTQVLVGSLGVNIGAVGGLDLEPQNNAFAALTPTGGSVTNFYTINLNTGSASLVGQINGGMLVTDIAVFIPEPAALALLPLSALVLARRRR